MNSLTIRLPNDLKADLQKFGREQDKAVSGVVRESIRRYGAVEKFRATGQKVLPFAESQGFLTDEDILEAIPSLFLPTPAASARRERDTTAGPLFARPGKTPAGSFFFFLLLLETNRPRR